MRPFPPNLPHPIYHCAYCGERITSEEQRKIHFDEDGNCKKRRHWRIAWIYQNWGKQTIQSFLKELTDKELERMIKEFKERQKEIHEETKRKEQTIRNLMKIVNAEKRRRKRNKKWRIA